MDKTIFSDKIRYLYQHLNISHKEFTKLFWDGTQKNFTSRSITVHQSWLEKGIQQPKGFYFEDYPISKLQIANEIPAFTRDSFLYDSLESFKVEVNAYINYTTKPKNEFRYKYIYLYDNNLEKIIHHKIIIKKELNEHRYRIEIVPYEFYLKNNISSYNGGIVIENDYYYFNIKNDFEIVSIYFIKNRGYMNNSKLNGISLGLQYSNGFPYAIKTLLTEDILSLQEERELYLISNETECISASITFNELYSNKQDMYIEKFHNDLNNFTQYIKKSKEILQNDIGDNIYLHLFQRNFKILNGISKKVVTKQNFLMYDQRSTTEIFLKSIANSSYPECSISYPTFGKELSLFDEKDKSAIKYLELNINLAKRGLKMNRILIIQDYGSMTDYCIKSIKRLAKSGVNLKIALKDDVDRLEIISYDFIYNSQKKFAMYKNFYDKRSIFKMTQDSEKIERLYHQYQKLDDISYTIDEFFTKKYYIKGDEVLEHLVARWYLYTYQVSKDLTQKPNLLNVVLDINSKENINYIYKQEIVAHGIIDSSSEYQIFLKFKNIKSKRAYIINLDKNIIHKDIFKVFMSYKYSSTSKNVSSLGILSRIKLDKNRVRETLGSIDKCMFIEDDDFNNRIERLYPS